MSVQPDFSQLNPVEMQRMAVAGNYKQMKNVIATLESVIQECFQDCVVDLSLREIQLEEKNCLKKCHSKFFAGMERSSLRLQEQQMKLQIQLNRTT